MVVLVAPAVVMVLLMLNTTTEMQMWRWSKPTSSSSTTQPNQYYHPLLAQQTAVVVQEKVRIVRSQNYCHDAAAAKPWTKTALKKWHNHSCLSKAAVLLLVELLLFPCWSQQEAFSWIVIVNCEWWWVVSTSCAGPPSALLMLKMLRCLTQTNPASRTC